MYFDEDALKIIVACPKYPCDILGVFFIFSLASTSPFGGRHYPSPDWSDGVKYAIVQGVLLVPAGNDIPRGALNVKDNLYTNVFMVQFKQYNLFMK